MAGKETFTTMTDFTRAAMAAGAVEAVVSGLRSDALVKPWCAKCLELTNVFVALG